MRENRTKVFHVDIMASGQRGVFYAGRAFEHRERVLDGFTRRYWVDRLVYFERHNPTWRTCSPALSVPKGSSGERST